MTTPVNATVARDMNSLMWPRIVNSIARIVWSINGCARNGEKLRA